MKQFLWTALVGVAVVLVLETDVNAEVVNEEAEAGARKALEYFMEKWNTGDDEKLRTAMHFPFITFGGGKNVFVKENPEDFSQHFDRMKENDGWASSSFDYDTLKFYMSTEDKVHLSIDYNRFKADGEKYGTGNVFYVVIKKDGRWGMQLRSGGRAEAHAEDRDAIIAEARKAVVGYMKEFNASDANGTVSHLNFPHFFMINGGVMLAENAEGRSAKPNFDRMRDSENWFFQYLRLSRSKHRNTQQSSLGIGIHQMSSRRHPILDRSRGLGHYKSRRSLGHPVPVAYESNSRLEIDRQKVQRSVFLSLLQCVLYFVYEIVIGGTDSAHQEYVAAHFF